MSENIMPPPPSAEHMRIVRILTSMHILMKISSVISIVSSFLLARHILKKKDASLTNVMLVGISVMDMIGSFFGYFMGGWMMGTREDVDSHLLSGNQQTCTTQGFILTFSFTYFVTAYAELGALYTLIVRRGWTKNDLKKSKIRVAFLLPPIIVALAMAVPPLFYQMYNPSYFLCYLNQYPFDCESDPDVPCTRGANALIAQQIILLYNLLCTSIVVVFMGLLIFSVYRQEKKIDRYLSKGQEKNRDNTISTAWQGVRYAVALTVPFTPLYVFLVYTMRKTTMDEVNLIFWTYLNCILTPLLGFNNACVYFYPRYKACRKSNQDKTKFRCLCDTLGISLPCGKTLWTNKLNSDENLTEPLVDDNVI